MCRELPKEICLDTQRECLLDTTYYHVVFTVPHDLNPLFYCSQKELYGLLFHSAAETFLELSADGFMADLKALEIMNKKIHI